jgi:hypothetical protein
MKKSKLHPNPNGMVRQLLSFTSPLGAKCEVISINQHDWNCSVLNVDTGEIAKANFRKIIPMLPKWDVNKQKIVE